MVDMICEIDGVSEYRLQNGLKVLIAENHSAPVATLLIVYKVGSRNEAVGYTGATHFLEHMLFKGTSEHNAETGNGIDDLLTQIGAYWNATTWFDRTSYYEVVPIEFFELCVKLEADRMRNLRLRQQDHDSEMSVVRNELERGENHPEEALEKELYAIAFREHPYHHPTIGWRSDVEGVSMDRLREFYNTFYWPDNATVIALGDFKREDALATIQKYFGEITAAPHEIPEVYTVEPPQQGERRFEVTRSGDLARVWIGFHVPEASHVDNFPLALLRQILGGSGERSSRLYKSLIDTSMAADVFARHDDLRDPGLFIIGATANEGVDLGELEKALLQEIDKLKTESVSPQELQRIKTANAKGTILAKADPSSLAFMLGEAESKADWHWLMDYDALFEKVSGDDIQRVVNTYFVKNNRTIGRFMPRPDSDQDDLDQDFEDEEDGPQKPLYTADEIKDFLDVQVAPLTLKFEDDAGSDFANKVEKKVLSNGMTLLVMEDHSTESVAVSFNLKAGRYYTNHLKSSCAELIGDLLPRGSKHFDRNTIAENLEEMGVPGALESYVDNYRVSSGTHLVKSDLAKYLDMLADSLIYPDLAESELQKTKIEWNARFIEAKTNTRALAWNKMRQLIYPSDHPFSDKDFDQQVTELAQVTAGDLANIHKDLFSPHGAIITLVGDITMSQAQKLIEERFGAWSGKAIQNPIIQAVGLPKIGLQEKLYLPEKASLDIVMAHPCALRRTDQDFYAARIANAALGQDTITSRIGQIVRDRAGLTYGIHSSFADTAFGVAPWSVSYSTNPTNLERSLQLARASLKDYLDKGIDPNDLAKEAGRALGSFKVGLASIAGIARVLTEFEFLGLGAKELDLIASRYQSLTKTDVDKAMQTHFHPDKLVTVISGTF
ncbi:MAG: insulinase family protein [Candidatus Melainabacteria bacterium]|jgi:zinc protease|nr:insulinase family protein [Candidatus Melainabacteria bacterium]